MVGPGFVAGSLGRSRVQRKPKVFLEGSEVPVQAVDDLPGGVSDFLVSALPGPAVPEDAAEYSPSQIAGSDPVDSDSITGDELISASTSPEPVQPVSSPEPLRTPPVTTAHYHDAPSASVEAPVDVDTSLPPPLEHHPPAVDQEASGPESKRARVSAVVCEN